MRNSKEKNEKKNCSKIPMKEYTSYHTFMLCKVHHESVIRSETSVWVSCYLNNFLSFVNFEED